MSDFGNFVARANKVVRNTETLIRQINELSNKNKYLLARNASLERIEAVRNRLQDKFEQSEEFQEELKKLLPT